MSQLFAVIVAICNITGIFGTSLPAPCKGGLHSANQETGVCDKDGKYYSSFSIARDDQIY